MTSKSLFRASLSEYLTHRHQPTQSEVHPKLPVALASLSIRVDALVMTPNDAHRPSNQTAFGSPANKALSIVGLLLAVVVPALAITRAWSMPSLSDSAAALILTATPFLVLLWVVWVEKRPLATIGLRRLSWSTVVYGLAGVVINVAISGVVGHLFGPETQSAAMTRMLKGPGWIVVVVVTSGALLTEIAFRGYAIERISELVGYGLWFGAIVQLVFTTALFIESRGLSHGLIWLIDDIVFNWYYIRRRDTNACLIAHAIPNFVASTLVATGLAS